MLQSPNRRNYGQEVNKLKPIFTMKDYPRAQKAFESIKEDYSSNPQVSNLTGMYLEKIKSISPELFLDTSGTKEEAIPGAATEESTISAPPSGLYRRDDRCQSRVEDQTVRVIFPPLDLAYPAAVAEHAGADCYIIDAPSENISWEEFSQKLTETSFDLIMLSVTYPTLSDDLRAAELAKKIILIVWYLPAEKYSV